MAIIFLNLGPRKTGGELLPGDPFRAFVKFNASNYGNFGAAGGFVTLELVENKKRVGTAMIDWPAASPHRKISGDTYWVGNGSLDEVDLIEGLTDRRKHQLVIRAIKRAGWTYQWYSPKHDPVRLRHYFQEWVQDNL